MDNILDDIPSILSKDECAKFRRDLGSGDANLQCEVIRLMDIYLVAGDPKCPAVDGIPFINTAYIPRQLLEDLMKLFFDEITDFNVRRLCLKLFYTMCRRYDVLMGIFSEMSLYSELFRRCECENCPYSLEEWMPVIECFISCDMRAFDFFSNSGKLLSYIDSRWLSAKPGEQIVMMEVLETYVTSKWFDIRDEASTRYLLGRAYEIVLSPDIMLKTTPMVRPAIVIMSRLLRYLADTDEMGPLYSSGACCIIMRLISVEDDNINLARDCCRFLAIASEVSRTICEQLYAGRVLQCFGEHLCMGCCDANSKFRACFYDMLLCLYNMFVEMNGMKTDISDVVKSGHLRVSDDQPSLGNAFLWILENAPAAQMNLVIGILCIIVYNLELIDDAVNVADSFDLYRLIVEQIEYEADPENTACVLAAAVRLLCDENPKPSVMQLIDEAVLEPLEKCMDDCDIQPRTRLHAEKYHECVIHYLENPVCLNPPDSEEPVTESDEDEFPSGVT